MHRTALFACLLLVLATEVARADGLDWENPGVYQRGQEPGHAQLMSYASVEEALEHAPKSAATCLVLNGPWRFHWAASPSEAPEGFETLGYDVSSWQAIEVPGNWQMQGFGHPMFRNIAHPFESDPPLVPERYNPVGSYRREFELPAGWEGHRILLHFEAVKSAAYFWLNGKELGYNQGGMEPVEFDVTERVRPGTNTLAVRVLRYSDGTYLEDQDMWRLSGIYRDVYLRAPPLVHVRDLYITTDLDASYRDAVLSLQVEIANASGQDRQGYGVRAHLYRDGERVLDQPLSGTSPVLRSKQTATIELSALVPAPALWSAERPDLYLLVVELVASGGEVVETVSSRVGFREIEVVDQALLVNGRAVTLNAVNSHVHHPESGRAMDLGTMRRDLVLMKQFNVNAVRTSHYPPNVEYLDLADQLGVYVIDETNNEAHATTHLSGLDEWRAQYLNRAARMVLRDRNHPSIVMWSAGNESGSGENICALIAEGKRLDPSRPAWMYGGNNDYSPSNAPLDCEDVIGPRYPTPFELRTRIASVPISEDSRPSFMDEYLAATGNGLGGLDEYWEVIRACRRSIGGAVWDWVSPGIRRPWISTPDSSPHGNDGVLMGRAGLIEGRFGRALRLSGHDEWLELYRDPSLDVAGSRLTLDAWVLPGPWNGTGALLTKGSNQYGLVQTDAQTLEFYLHAGERVAVTARVPQDWEEQWHHVAGVYDGRQLALWIDGEAIATRAHTGMIDSRPFPFNVGRNAEVHGQEHPGELSNAAFDRVRIFARALSAAELASNSPQLRQEALLWLDFDEAGEQGEFYSLGIGGRSYGVVWPDRSVQPELWQLKKSAQPIGFEPVELDRGRLRIINHHSFTDLGSLDASWQLTADGEVVQSGRLDVALAPSDEATIEVPFARPDPVHGSEYRLRVAFSLREESPWAPAGHEIAWEEFDLPWEAPLPGAPIAGPTADAIVPLELDETRSRLVLRGADFTYAFDVERGVLSSMVFRGVELLRSGPRTSVWRPPLANERDGWGTHRGKLRTAQQGMGNDIANGWRSVGLDRLEQKVARIETVRVSSAEVRVEIDARLTSGIAQGAASRPGFDVSYVYRILGSGDVLLHQAVTPQGEMPEWLPKAGLELVLAPHLEAISWYGRGPHETYPDRKTGARMGIYTSTLAKEYQPYLVPQDYGNKSDVRWVALTGPDGIGLFAAADVPLEVSARHFSTDNLSRASYSFQLAPQDGVTLNLDHRVSGVGGTAISVLPEYRVAPVPWQYTTRLRPFDANEEPAATLYRHRSFR